MNFVTQPSVELYKAITNRLYADAQRSGGIVKSKSWVAFMESTSQARWRGNVVLHYDRLALPDLDAASTAPAIYAAILRSLFSDRSAEYGELTSGGLVVPGAHKDSIVDHDDPDTCVSMLRTGANAESLRVAKRLDDVISKRFILCHGALFCYELKYTRSTKCFFLNHFVLFVAKTTTKSSEGT